jgi:asparagine synthase (glutamine-hydrolysing)
MCGFAGFWTTGGITDPWACLSSMAAALARRGPDAEGTNFEANDGVGFAHRRLSIVDLSPDGAQPMQSASGRYVIAYNGEVYNHGELRREIAQCGVRFRGGADTETVLEAIQEWGLFRAVERFNGMFAFALWDRVERRLHLVRDRVGIKPLYYGFVGQTLVFGSDLASFRTVPGFAGTVDRESLALFLRFNYVPAPHSIYESIRKLPAGSIITFDSARSQPEPQRYWRAADAVRAGSASPFRGSAESATDHLEQLLSDAVSARMMADVPLGAFLSGGIDSSVVVSLMQRHSSRPVKTFSIGFEEAEFDEAGYAAGVANHLGTDHTELYVTPRDSLDVIPSLPSYYSEPFSDSSQIPTYLVSKLARAQVTVALSGDGGDELFAGYNRYMLGQSLWRVISRTPGPIIHAIASAIRGVSPDAWDRILTVLRPIMPQQAIFALPGDKIHKLSEVLEVTDFPSLYRRIVSHWKRPGEVVLGVTEPSCLISEASHSFSDRSVTEQMMYWDLMTYLPDDILVKVDRASMAVGLEARVPLLDHHVVEFAWSLPLSYKKRDGQSKWVLRQVLDRHVPRNLIDRPKKGFGVPLGQWLCGDLRDWAESLLDRKRLEEDGFFDADVIRTYWREHLSGKRRWQYYLWDILMFQAWLDHSRRR